MSDSERQQEVDVENVGNGEEEGDRLENLDSTKNQEAEQLLDAMRDGGGSPSAWSARRDDKRKQIDADWNFDREKDLFIPSDNRAGATTRRGAKDIACSKCGEAFFDHLRESEIPHQSPCGNDDCELWSCRTEQEQRQQKSVRREQEETRRIGNLNKKKSITKKPKGVATEPKMKKTKKKEEGVNGKKV